MIRHLPQRVVLTLLAGALAPGAAARGQAAAAQLWRLAAATVALPPALASGSAAAFWNPAQALGDSGPAAGLEIVQTPAVVGASGFLASIHTRLRAVGTVGVLYGRMLVGDLTRTSVSPDPDPGTIPYHAASLGLTWGRPIGRGATVGAALRFNASQLDRQAWHRWTFDVGVQQRIGLLRLAAATHFLSATRGDPAQDVYAGLGLRLWRGEAWSGSRETTVELRYGIAFGHALPADHQVGIGFDVGKAFGADALLVREGSLDGRGWRPVGGVRLVVGRHRVTVARDGGVNDVGAAFRVGLEVGLGR